MTTIGFIGLGHMGNPMARHLLKSGAAVYAYDINPQAVAALVDAGAKAANSLITLAEHADVVITSLQTGQQVMDTCLHHDGLFSHLAPDKLFIDCSSIDVTTTHFLHAEAEKVHIAMLDAPVSGGVAGAEAATLTFMLGGRAEEVTRALPLLSRMGKKLYMPVLRAADKQQKFVIIFYLPFQ